MSECVIGCSRRNACPKVVYMHLRKEFDVYVQSIHIRKSGVHKEG